MALFQQKKPQAGHRIPLYSLGQNKAVLIVGLGNIGKEYTDTRHNIGFACVDRFVADTDLSGWIEKKDMKCHIASGQLGDTKVHVIKPTTFMNLSGEAVQAVAHFYRIQLENIVVVHDELDIPFGQIRMRIGGSPAGHNGIKSISQAMGEDYGRVRVGIGPKLHEQQDSSDFVLARFSKEQEEQMKNLTREVTAVLSEYVYGGQLVAETRSFIV
ncbi:MAG TPA: aminoacyl-tRNA hydrolase [Candidatus Saccharimonadales bacterium]|nr:aminoacyl-tRNA hydrolase [Candidatus Saccharimonadales bacterium]